MANTESKATPLLCFAGVDYWYHARAHSDIQLMLQAARHRPVLLINSVGMRMPMPGRSSKPLRRILRKAASVGRLIRRPRADLPDFHVYSPLSLPMRGRAGDLNVRFLRVQISAALRWLGMRRPDIFLTPPTAWPVAQGLTHRSVFYNRSDKHSEFPGADQDHLRRLEDSLLQNAVRILYVNAELMEEERQATGTRGHLLDHGVDLDLFAPGLDLPPDLARIPGPRIGFFGGLREHLVDFDLLEALADARPNAQIVLVGEAASSLDRLLVRDNVHWLGKKSHEEIPAYGCGFDVALMPYRDVNWIRYCNPIKLKEYLALGLPVVSTDFPEVHRFQKHIRIAGTTEQFIDEVSAALEESDPAQASARRESLSGQQWGDKACELLALYDDFA